MFTPAALHCHIILHKTYTPVLLLLWQLVRLEAKFISYICPAGRTIESNSCYYGGLAPNQSIRSFGSVPAVYLLSTTTLALYWKSMKS